MARRRKLVRVRGPRLRVTPSGKVGLNKPSVRIGGRRTGINVSSRGVSVSTRGRGWSYNSRRGCAARIPGCLIPILLVLAIGLSLARVVKAA
jgi:hypothetical protein